jgi:D-serine deaminase-like pyridoxal phosphate-dependent protein
VFAPCVSVLLPKAPSEMQDLDLPSPSFCVSLPQFTKNCEAMRQRAVDLGLALRPHVKVQFCPAVLNCVHVNSTVVM